MALKTTNKNRKPEPASDVGIDTHEKAFTAITELSDLNKDITSRNVLWTVVGVAIGLTVLVFII